MVVLITSWDTAGNLGLIVGRLLVRNWKGRRSHSKYGNGAIGGVVNVIDGRIPTATFESPEFVFEQSHSSVNDEDTARPVGGEPVGSADFVARPLG